MHRHLSKDAKYEFVKDAGTGPSLKVKAIKKAYWATCLATGYVARRAKSFRLGNTELYDETELLRVAADTIPVSTKVPTVDPHAVSKICAQLAKVQGEAAVASPWLKDITRLRSLMEATSLRLQQNRDRITAKAVREAATGAALKPTPKPECQLLRIGRTVEGRVGSSPSDALTRFRTKVRAAPVHSTMLLSDEDVGCAGHDDESSKSAARRRFIKCLHLPRNAILLTQRGSGSIPNKVVVIPTETDDPLAFDNVEHAAVLEALAQARALRSPTVAAAKTKAAVKLLSSMKAHDPRCAERLYSLLNDGDAGSFDAAELDAMLECLHSTDPDTVTEQDLRAFNLGNTQGKFEPFLENVMVVLNGVAASDARRHGSPDVQRMSQVVSISDLLERAHQLDPSLPVPEHSWLERQFMPEDSTKSSSRKGRIRFKHSVQRRVLSAPNHDSHYAVVVNRWWREYFFSWSEKAEELGCRALRIAETGGDDKSNMQCGLPGMPMTAITRRNGGALCPAGANPLAADHDMNPAGKVIPSVCHVSTTLPPDRATSRFGNGHVFVTLKCATFSPSTALGHWAQLYDAIGQLPDGQPGGTGTAIENRDVIWMQTDKGADHNPEHLKVQLGALALLLMSGTDMVVMTSHAGGDSAKNLVERSMSLLNLALQNYSTELGGMSKLAVAATKKAGTMSGRRTEFPKCQADAKLFLSVRRGDGAPADFTPALADREQLDDLHKSGTKLGGQPVLVLRHAAAGGVREEHDAAMKATMAETAERMGRLTLKGKKVKATVGTFTAVEAKMRDALLRVDPNYDPTVTAMSDMEKTMPAMCQVFQDHVSVTKCQVVIQKCGKASCPLPNCANIRMPEAIRTLVMSRKPTPAMKKGATSTEHETYHTAEDSAKMGIYDDEDMPSKTLSEEKRKKTKAASAKHARDCGTSFRASQRRAEMRCCECSKPRIVCGTASSFKAVQAQVDAVLDGLDDEVPEFACGNSFVPETHPLNLVGVMNRSVTCGTPLEEHCAPVEGRCGSCLGTKTSLATQEEIVQVVEAAAGRVVLNTCTRCLDAVQAGKGVIGLAYANKPRDKIKQKEQLVAAKAAAKQQLAPGSTPTPTRTPPSSSAADAPVAATVETPAGNAAAVETQTPASNTGAVEDDAAAAETPASDAAAVETQTPASSTGAVKDDAAAAETPASDTAAAETPAGNAAAVETVDAAAPAGSNVRRTLQFTVDGPVAATAAQAASATATHATATGTAEEGALEAAQPAAAADPAVEPVASAGDAAGDATEPASVKHARKRTCNPGDVVDAPDEDDYYRATVIETDLDKGTAKVHYQGWSKKYDAEVSIDDLRDPEPEDQRPTKRARTTPTPFEARH